MPAGPLRGATSPGCATPGNPAATKGGGIRLYNAQAVIGGCEITFNTAGEEGGGIHCASSTMSTPASTLTDNDPENVFCDECEGCTES